MPIKLLLDGFPEAFAAMKAADRDGKWLGLRHHNHGENNTSRHIVVRRLKLVS
ncbi:hypothetical protein QD460_15625 [Rhizobium jaguaris]|uniref:hypothetical protein n=1 Tax=Rhizobium jaguaris TaxID=1312183 RepID=UPI0039BF048C